MKISFYGRLGELIGREIAVQVPPETDTVRALRTLLATLHPNAAEALVNGAVRAAVDGAVVGDDAPIGNASSVDFLPPLSGG